MKSQGIMVKHLLEWLKWVRLSIPIIGENMEGLKHSYITSWNVKWHNYFRKHFGRFERVECALIWSNRSTVTYLKEMKACVHAKTWGQMFIAVLFLIARTEKQFKYPACGMHIRGIRVHWHTVQQEKGTDGSQNHYDKRKKPDQKSTYYNAISAKFEKVPSSWCWQNADPWVAWGLGTGPGSEAGVEDEITKGHRHLGGWCSLPWLWWWFHR